MIDLTDYFEIALSAPDGIKKLREMILTLAMQGKLVPQDPADQPAAELLKDIAAEKKRLVKAGKIKPPKPLPPIAPEEIPFEIPSSWEWVKLGDVGIINPRNNGCNDYDEAGFVPMPLIFAETGKTHLFEKRLWKDIKKGYTHFADGDVGLAKITPCFENGKSCVFTGLPNGLGAGTTELHVFRNVFQSIFPTFLLFYLKNPFYLKNGANHMTGSAGQKRVPTDFFANNPFPLPPLAEQKRIVAKVEQLMAECDALAELKNKQEIKLRETHQSAIARLLDVSTLAEAWQFMQTNFETLCSTRENVAELRKAILQLAVMGKLVPQDPADQPATQLLKAIETERELLVKQKKTKMINIDYSKNRYDIPYQIPKDWKYCRLQDLFAIITDGDHQPPPKANRGIPFLVIGNLNKKTISFENCRYVNNEYYNALDWSKKPVNNDILYTVTGSFGITVKVKCNSKFCVQRHVAILKSTPSTPIDYIDYFLSSVFGITYVKSIATGIAQKTVPLSGLRAMPIALPPLAEQKRIVAKVEQLMALCDQLEQKITRAKETQSVLIGTLVAQN